MGANPWSDLCVASAGLEPYGWVALEVEDLTICFPFSLFLSFYSIIHSIRTTHNRFFGIVDVKLSVWR